MTAQERSRGPSKKGVFVDQDLKTGGLAGRNCTTFNRRARSQRSRICLGVPNTLPRSRSLWKGRKRGAVAIAGTSARQGSPEDSEQDHAPEEHGDVGDGQHGAPRNDHPSRHDATFCPVTQPGCRRQILPGCGGDPPLAMSAVNDHASPLPQVGLGSPRHGRCRAAHPASRGWCHIHGPECQPRLT